VKHSRMFHAVMILAVVAAVAAPATADVFVGEGNLFRVNGLFVNGFVGGEFTVRTNALSTAAYDPRVRNQAGGASNFQSFCVEFTEFVTNPVDIVVNTSGPTGSQAVQGGQTSENGVDPLEYQTAYLYTQFATGQLGDYDYDNMANRALDARSLQQAIWFFEEGIATTDAQSLVWIDEANDAVADANIWGETIGNVRILNMFGAGTFGGDEGGSLAQDQLFIIPAPGSAILGVLGLGALALVRRRF